MSYKFYQKLGFTLLELVIAMAISVLILSGVVITFQNFGIFNTWIMHFSLLQKSSMQEIINIHKTFAQENIFLDTDTIPLAYNIKDILSQNKNNLTFNYLSVVKDTTGQQIEINDQSGLLAIHKGIFWFDMTIDDDQKYLYVVDSGYHVIRRFDLEENQEDLNFIIGELGTSGDSVGMTVLAHFRNPTGIVYFKDPINAKEYLFVSDTGNHVIRKIDIATKTVSTLAGFKNDAEKTGIAGNSDGTVFEAFFNYPTGITVNKTNGDLYVADTGNNVIKKISRDLNGEYKYVITILGNNKAGNTNKIAKFSNTNDWQNFSLNNPLNLAYDNALGHIYINDFSNERILRLSENYEVVEISDKYTKYGGLKIYGKDGLNYLEYQEMDTGKIKSFNVLDFTVSELIDTSSFLNYISTDFLNMNFIRLSKTDAPDDLLISGFKKENSTFMIQKLYQQDNLKLNIVFYGDGGVWQLKTWDEKAHVFTKFTDFIGESNLIQLTKRINPTSYNQNMMEILLKYKTKRIDPNEDTEFKYSLILNEHPLEINF